MKKALSSKHVDTEARKLSNGTSYFVRYFDIYLLYLFSNSSMKFVNHIYCALIVKEVLVLSKPPVCRHFKSAAGECLTVNYVEGNCEHRCTATDRQYHEKFIQ